MTIFLVVLILLGLNIFIHGLRIKYVNKLYALYDRLENNVIKEGLTPDKQLKTFLKIHKNVIFNNQVLDIWYLINASVHIERDDNYRKTKEDYIQYFNSLPESVKNVSSAINKRQDFVIVLSILKPVNLIVFSLSGLLAIVFSMIFKFFKAFGIVLNTIAKLPLALRDIIHADENFIIQKDKYKVFLS